MLAQSESGEHVTSDTSTVGSLTEALEPCHCLHVPAKPLAAWVTTGLQAVGTAAATGIVGCRSRTRHSSKGFVRTGSPYPYEVDTVVTPILQIT